jgi:hypothetical protein
MGLKESKASVEKQDKMAQLAKSDQQVLLVRMVRTA